MAENVARIMTHWDDLGSAHVAIWIDDSLVYCTDIKPPSRMDGNMAAADHAKAILWEAYDTEEFQSQDRQTVWGKLGQLSKYKLPSEYVPRDKVQKPPSIIDAARRIKESKRSAPKEPGLGGLFGC